MHLEEGPNARYQKLKVYQGFMCSIVNWPLVSGAYGPLRGLVHVNCGVRRE